MNKNLRVEKMMAGDIDLVYAMHLRNSDDDPNRYVIDWLNETTNDPYGYFFIAYWGDELVGYCGMYHNTSVSNPDLQAPDYCKIGNIVVRKDFRRKGIGKALMLKMLTKANELRVDRTKLEVSTKNDAVKLYKSLGFQIEETNESFYDNGDDAFIMWHYSMDNYSVIKKIFERDINKGVVSISKYESVFIIETDDKKYIFKMYRSDGYPEKDKMIFVSKWLTENDIPHAKICSYNRNDDDLPNGYIIEEYLSGISADRLVLTEQETCDIYKKLAFLTSKIHKITFSKHGFITCGVPDCLTFTEHIEKNFIYGTNKIRSVYTDEELTNLKHQLIEKLKPCDDIQPCLCHIDIQLKNMIVDGNKIIFVDWDDARSFPAIVDIARLTLLMELDYNHEQAEIYKKAFLDNYEFDDEPKTYYELETALHIWHGLIILNFCDEAGPQFIKIKTIVNKKIKLLK